jgi:AcrR family transcriptional regulator
VAWKEFANQGYSSASIERVARVTGIPKSTIYRRYKDKRTLFIECCRYCIFRTFSNPISINYHYAPEKIILTLAEGILEKFLTDDNLILHRVLLVESGRDPNATHQIYSYLVDLIDEMIAPCIGKLVDIGAIRPELSQQAAWRLFIMSTFGNRYLFVPPTSKRQMSLQLKEAARLFLYGCKNGPS